MKAFLRALLRTADNQAPSASPKKQMHTCELSDHRRPAPTPRLYTPDAPLLGHIFGSFSKAQRHDCHKDIQEKKVAHSQDAVHENLSRDAHRPPSLQGNQVPALQLKPVFNDNVTQLIPAGKQCLCFRASLPTMLTPASSKLRIAAAAIT